MLTLEIRDNQLHTSKDFSVQIDCQNPATKFDGIEGSRAIGIELPINDVNRIILDNPDRFEKMGNINDRRFLNAALRHFGQIIQKGTLVIDGASKTYSGWLRDIVGNLAERVTGTFINQSALGGTKTFVNKTTYDPATDDYACPKLFNRHFWRDRGKISTRNVTATDLEGNEFITKEEDGELTWQFFTNEQFLVNFPTGSGTKTDGTNTAPVVSPMLFLWKALELILSDNYIFITENFLKTDTSLKKLIVYNNFNITQQQLATNFKTLYYIRYHENLDFSAVAKAIFAVTYAAGTFSYGDLLPKITLGEAVLSVQNLLNVVFSFNDLNECRIVDRQKLLTIEAYDIDEYMVGEWELGERKDVTVKLEMEHDPQDYAFTDNWQDLSDIRANIKAAVQQKTDLDALTPAMDEIRLVTGENRYYQYHWHVLATIDKKGSEVEEDILGWEPISIGFQPYFYNDGDKDVEEIKTKFSTLRQSENGYPLTMQKGNANLFKTQPEAFTPRLLFYEGGEAASYRTSALSLDYAEANGLANKRWNYWLPFWANRLPANATFKFPASIFYYIKNNKALLPLRTRHGSFIIDKIDAIAGKAETIETKLHVFKRESVTGFTEGSVGGAGDITPVVFTPLYVGLTATGKPYLVNQAGEVRIPPAWGTLSTAPHAKTVCLDYDPVNKLLFTGGINGMLYIIDMADIGNFAMKGIKVFATGNVSGIRYLNGQILIGKDAGNAVYSQPHFAAFASYTDYQATATGILANGYTAKDFEYVAATATYYCCTQAGEVFESTDLGNAWVELVDYKADFRKIIQTTNKLIVFGKDDNKSGDRQFSANKTNPASWSEFDIEPSPGIYATEAIATGNDEALAITNKEYSGAKIIAANNSVISLTPNLARYCGGAVLNGDWRPVIAIQEGSGATKLATWFIAGWQYTNVPVWFTKLFNY